MTGHLVSHLLRRGVSHAAEHFSQKQVEIVSLEQDVPAYEDGGKPIHPAEFLPVLITALIAIFAIWSIDYTIGQVMSALTMIESPSATAIIDSKPPAYADVPDAASEKEHLMPAEADVDADVEVVLINNKPITAKITTTMGLLHRVGGFTARWRGVGLAVLYHFLHASFTNLFASLMSIGLAGEILSYILTSMLLVRVHFAWTQKMITYPSKQWWWQRGPSRSEIKALLFPSLVYAVAEQATLALPVAVAFALNIVGQNHQDIINEHTGMDCAGLVTTFLSLLAVPATYIAVAFLILLPASVTLTRIEASLLREGDETIVPFDKMGMMGELDINVAAGRRALFVNAWRSFDRSSRWRLIKLYAKMLLAQFTVALVSIQLIVAELYLIGPDRIADMIKSGLENTRITIIQAGEAAEGAE